MLFALDDSLEFEENRTIVKTSNISSFVVGLIALLLSTTPAFAGTVTITSGPNLTPPEAFTNNTFTVQVLHDPPGVSGDLLQATGGATVTQPASNTASGDISGTFTANAGDIASVAYSVTMDTSGTVPIAYTASASVTFLGVPQTFSDSGTIMPGLHHYNGTWQAPAPFPLAGAGTWSASLTLSFSSADGAAGATPEVLVVSIDELNMQLATTPATVPPPSQALNVSTRLAVLTGDNALIGGLILTGTDPKRVLIRGIGPSLSVFFTGALADPTLELFQGSTLVASNNNWRDTQETEIQATGIAPTDNLESAILQTLSPGSYTAVLRGSGDTIGVGVVEAYDLDQNANSQLANISTRGFVDTGDNVMIGGFILGPDTSGSSTVVVRGIGPSLGALGVPNAMQDPTLELHDGSGTLISSNDNWMDFPHAQTIADSGLAPSNNSEAAVLEIPPPGNYTAIVRGANNTTGVGLVEVYKLP
jgi:hypothetical protein